MSGEGGGWVANRNVIDLRRRALQGHLLSCLLNQTLNQHTWNPSVWEAMEENLEFEASLDYAGIPCLKTARERTEQWLPISSTRTTVGAHDGNSVVF